MKPKSLLRLSSSLKTKLILSSSEEDEDSAICTSKLQQSSSDDSDHESNRKMARRQQKRPKTSLTTYSSDEEQSPKKKKRQCWKLSCFCRTMMTSGKSFQAPHLNTKLYKTKSKYKKMFQDLKQPKRLQLGENRFAVAWLHDVDDNESSIKCCIYLAFCKKFRFNAFWCSFFVCMHAHMDVCNSSIY